MICPIPLRDFAFSGSQKLKNLLASQGRRLKAGVAKDLGQNRTPLPEAHDTSACPQVRGPSGRARPRRAGLPLSYVEARIKSHVNSPPWATLSFLSRATDGLRAPRRVFPKGAGYILHSSIIHLHPLRGDARPTCTQERVVILVHVGGSHRPCAAQVIVGPERVLEGR